MWELVFIYQHPGETRMESWSRAKNWLDNNTQDAEFLKLEDNAMILKVKWNYMTRYYTYCKKCGIRGYYFDSEFVFEDEDKCPFELNDKRCIKCKNCGFTFERD